MAKRVWDAWEREFQSMSTAEYFNLTSRRRNSLPSWILANHHKYQVNRSPTASPSRNDTVVSDDNTHANTPSDSEPTSESDVVTGSEALRAALRAAEKAEHNRVTRKPSRLEDNHHVSLDQGESSPSQALAHGQGVDGGNAAASSVLLLNDTIIDELQDMLLGGNKATGACCSHFGSHYLLPAPDDTVVAPFVFYPDQYIYHIWHWVFHYDIHQWWTPDELALFGDFANSFMLTGTRYVNNIEVTYIERGFDSYYMFECRHLSPSRRDSRQLPIPSDKSVDHMSSI